MSLEGDLAGAIGSWLAPVAGLALAPLLLACVLRRVAEALCWLAAPLL